MAHVYQRLAVATISTLAIAGSISRAEAFQFFSDRNAWEAAVAVPTETFNFGDSRTFSGTTVFPNGISATESLFNGDGSANNTTIGAVLAFPVGGGTGSVRGRVSVNLPKTVNALGFDASIGPANSILFANFISEAGSLPNSRLLVTPAFTGIITEPGDPLITGFYIESNAPGTGFFNASNISVPVRTSVPEGCCANGLLVAISTFVVGTVFLRKSKQVKLTAAELG